MGFSHYKQAFSSFPEKTCLHKQLQSLGQSRVTADRPCSLSRHGDVLADPSTSRGVFAAFQTGAELNHLHSLRLGQAFCGLGHSTLWEG